MTAWAFAAPAPWGRAAAALGAIGFLAAAAHGEPATAWLTGSALPARLAQPVDVYWSDTPLRQAVNGLSRAHRVAALIDRRVDPGQKLDLKRSSLPLREVFQEIADSRGLGLAWLGPVAYLGPPGFTSRVRTLAALRRADMDALPASVGRKFLLAERIQWEDFATPRELLSQMAAQSGIEIFGLDQVPHDLWAEADLPALSLVERLTLIAGQFDLTFQVAADGSSIALIPVPEDVAMVRTYPGGRQPKELARQWAALAPQSRIQVDGEKIHVRGLLEDHERIAGAPQAPPQPAPRPARKGQAEDRFTGRVAGPLGQLLEQLAAKFQLELKIDREALQKVGISLQQNVSVDVQNATLDELLEAVLAEARCTLHRKGSVIEVRPAD